MKKLVSMMAVIACVFALTGCSGTSLNALEGTGISDVSTESYIITVGESFVAQVDALVREGYTSDYVDDEALGSALDEYANSLSDIGTIVSYDNEQAVIDEDGNYQINIGVVGTEHSADIVITIDITEGTLVSMATNVRYSSGELLSQAGLNMLLGMGTTFLVLVILALLIYCFRFIGIFQEKSRRKAALQQEAEAVPAAPAAEETAVEPEDDQELIAVIAAAVAAYEEQAGVPAGEYVVRSIRRSRRRQ